MSPEWTIIALLTVGLLLALSELRDARTDTGLERTERLRLQREKSVGLRERRQVAAPWPTRALPASKPKLDTAALSWPSPPVIDAASQTAELPLPEITWLDPMRPDHAAYRPHWPGTKENAHAR